MEKRDFNLGWYVMKDGCSEGKKVDLPHDAMIYEARCKEAAGAGACGYFEEGKYTYTKMLEVPAEWENGTVILECEAVYKNAVVLLNGEEIYRRPYGYTDFYVNLSGKLKAGQQNELTIIADNSKAPNTRWYSGSGIYRPVYLHVGPQLAIQPQGVKVTCLGGDEIRVETEVKQAGKELAVGEALAIEIYDGETLVAAGEAVSGEPFELTIPEAKRWSPEEPKLYTCRVTLKANGDSQMTTFGLRDLEWNGKGFFINGEETLLRGSCIHHDNGILGAACFADAEERRVRIMKENGFNAIRSSHNPISKAMLEACDRLGMLVMDESFDMWLIHKNPYDYAKEDFFIWWKEDTKAMIDKDYNHPSVIMYSIGNEISELGSAEGQALCKEMADYVRDLDSGRCVTAGINLMLASMVAKGKGLYGNGKEGEKSNGNGSGSMDSAPTSTFFNVLMNRMGGIMEKMAATKGADQVVEKVSGSLDIPGYNYAGARYAKEAKKYPERAFTGSETLPKSLYRNWEMVKKIPNLTGDFMWTGWDYLGEAGIGTVRHVDKKTKKDVDPGLIISGGCGVIDICGKARPETGWDKLIWGLQTDPTIGVEPYTHADDFAATSMWRNTDAVESWSWEGCEGKKSDVVVYAQDGFVQLGINGKTIGKKKVKEGKAIFRNIPYAPGYVAAISYDAAGNKLGKVKLITAEGETRISAKPEKTLLQANGQDLCFLNLDLIGENGITKSSVDQKLTVAVEGPGVLQAFGSARPNMAENFYSDTHTTYYGKALAVVRAGSQAGEIKVTVSGEGLEPVSVTITVE